MRIHCAQQYLWRSALMRRESRGSHFRDKFPHHDDGNWVKNIIFRLENGTLLQETGEIIE
ncbi:MAG: hypothetical protein P1S60_02030 [Anaerolineae bacterium]|nr:hypothetical protein [Anaerolineae bacterium]